VAERIRVAYTIMQLWHRVPGGTATSTLELARALRSTGEVDLIGVAPAGPLPPPPWTPPIPFRRVHLPYQLVYDAWHHLRRPGVERRTRAQVVHATAATVPPRQSAPLVVTIHDLFPLQTPEQFTPRGVRLLTRGIELARSDADLVICPSRATLEDCVAAGFDRDRLRLVPWGVTVAPVADAERQRVRARYQLDNPYVLWVGTIEPRKNLPMLLDAFRGLGARAEQLVLVGPPGWNESLDEHLVGLGHRVRRLGFVPSGDLAALYAEARLFCFPSTREGFGLPPLEAMARSTPVLVSADTAMSEVIGDGGLSVPADDVQAWSSAMMAVLDDPALAQRLSTEAVARAAEFTWELAARRTIDVYRELVA